MNLDTTIEDRVERLKTRPLFATPKQVVAPPELGNNRPPKTVRMHDCYSPIDGEQKAGRCRCEDDDGHKISFDEATDLVRHNLARWRVVRNANSKTLVLSKRSIVLNRTRKEIDGATLARRFERKEARRSEKFSEFEAKLLQKFRRMLTRAFAKQQISSSLFSLPDTELLGALKNPQGLFERFPDELTPFTPRIGKLSLLWWENRLAREQLFLPDTATAPPMFMPEAPYGRGKLLVAAPDKLAQIAAHWESNENGTRKVRGTNARAEQMNGRWFHPEGNGSPDDHINASMNVEDDRDSSDFDTNR